MTLFIVGITLAQADESSARLANAIKKYQLEKQQKTTNSVSHKENQTEKDHSSDSGEKILERPLNTDINNADPEPVGKSYLPPS
jgi:hypothetical protein